ncbi:MAG: peptide ABC transporter substrate-binding protein [Clostridia bacterium]
MVPGVDCYTLTGGYLGPDTYLPLVWMSKTDHVQYSRSIASNIAVSNHDTVYTVTLNKKWHWSNGQPITAQDVAYDAALVLAASGPTSPLAYCFTGEGGVPSLWKSVVAQGSDKVVITTTQPVNPQWFIYNGLTQLVPIPKAQWDKYSNMNQELKWINSIGANFENSVYKVVDGPYVPTRYVQDQYWEFKRNPQFDGSPKPSIPAITYHYEASSDSTFLDLSKGNVQIAQIPLNYYKPMKALTQYSIVPEPLFAFSQIQINFRPNDAGNVGPLLNQLYIRQALQYGIDQKGILKSILDGFGTLTNGPVPSVPPNPFYDSSMRLVDPFNPAKGKALLEAHGWTMQNGVMTKNGQKLQFVLLFGSGTPTTTDEMELIKANWAQEGIAVTLESEAPSTVGADVTNPADSSKWDLTPGGWIYAPDFDPGGDGLFNTGGGFNIGAYSNPTMDHLIHETDLAGSPRQIHSRFITYEQYATAELPVLWAPTADYVYAVNKDVVGFANNFSSYWSYTSDNYISFK